MNPPVCPICEIQAPTEELPCRHRFCLSCITSWLNIEPTCPNKCQSRSNRLSYDATGKTYAVVARSVDHDQADQAETADACVNQQASIIAEAAPVKRTSRKLVDHETVASTQKRVRVPVAEEENAYRSEHRANRSFSGDIDVSLYHGTGEDVRTRCTEVCDPSRRAATRTQLREKGLLEVVMTLEHNSGVLCFETSFCIFSSFSGFNVEAAKQDQKRDRRKAFRDQLCHPQYGIPILIIGQDAGRVVVLNGAVTPQMFQAVLALPRGNAQVSAERLHLRTSFALGLSAATTEWERQLVVFLSHATLSETEAHSLLGLSDGQGRRSTLRIMEFLSRMEEVTSSAGTEAAIRIQERLQSLRLRIELQQSLLEAQETVLHSRRVEWLRLELHAAQHSLSVLETNMVARQLDAQHRVVSKARELVKSEFMRMWPRTGAKTKSQSTEALQHYISLRISGLSGTVAESRRHSSQLHIEQHNLQRRTIWAFALEFQTLKQLHERNTQPPIAEFTAEMAIELHARQPSPLDLTSAVLSTVTAGHLASYGQPQSVRSCQGQSRLAGPGLQLWKVTATRKTIGLAHVNLRHDRAHRKYIRLLVARADREGLRARGQMILLSDDDHAYMNFRKQAGNRGGRDGRLLVDSNETPGVWKGDYSDNKLHIVPFMSVFLYPSLGEDARGKEQVVGGGSRDRHVVIMRSKLFPRTPQVVTQVWESRLQQRYSICPEEYEIISDREPLAAHDTSPSTCGPMPPLVRVTGDRSVPQTEPEQTESKESLRARRTVVSEIARLHDHYSLLVTALHREAELDQVQLLIRPEHNDYMTARLDNVRMATEECLSFISEAWDRISLSEREGLNRFLKWDMFLAEVATALATVGALHVSISVSKSVECSEPELKVLLSNLSLKIMDAKALWTSLLDAITALKFPGVRPIFHHSSDSGPGQGLRYRSVKVRTSEVILTWKIKQYTFKPAPPGHSSDNEVERSQSVVTTSAAAHQPRAAETSGCFQVLTLADLKAGTLDTQTLSEAELAAMKEASWDGCARLASICDGEPCQGSVLTSAVLEHKRAPLFADDFYLQAYCKAADSKRAKLPGAAHYSRMEKLLMSHSTVGHEFHYLEYRAHACKESDAFCDFPDHQLPSTDPVPDSVPVPIPAGPWADGEKGPVEWSHYMALQDIPPDWKTRYHLIQDVNRFNPLYCIDTFFSLHSIQLYEDWWDSISKGPPPSELSFQHPPQSVGAESHQLVKNMSVSVNGNNPRATTDVYRRIAHLMLLKMNIKRFSSAGAAAASCSKTKATKSKKATKKKRSIDSSDSDPTSSSEDPSDSEEGDAGEQGEEGEDGEVALHDACVSWAVLNSLTLKELKAVGDNFLPKKDAKEMPKKKALLSSLLAAHSIDEAQFGSFLGGFRHGLNPAKQNTEGTMAEVLLVSVAATGQFKGGRPTGKWFLAAAVVDGNTSVRAWNTHHKGILFGRVFHPSWTDYCDGKERFQSASPGTTWSATVCEIESTQVRDRFVLERGCIPLHIISRWKLK